jgi:predicted flap endonuclease-1-like 5' DNA nuclease
MGLFDTIKSILGKSESTSDQSGETSVAVEREPGDEAISESGEVDEPVAEPTDAAGSTESIVDEDAATEPTEAAEPAEAAGPESEDITTDVDDTGPEPEETADATESPSVQELKGIGPAYGERLADAGVGTVADLAEADPEDLAERTTVSESRLREWIERARDFEE